MEEIVPTQTLLGYNAAGLPLTNERRNRCLVILIGERMARHPERDT
jgi:hypothetical protein